MIVEPFDNLPVVVNTAATSFHPVVSISTSSNNTCEKLLSSLCINCKEVSLLRISSFVTSMTRSPFRMDDIVYVLPTPEIPYMQMVVLLVRYLFIVLHMFFLPGISGTFCFTILINISMLDDDLTNQALELLFENKTMKKKVTPVLFGGLCFNFILLILLIFIAFRITGVSRRLDSLMSKNIILTV